MSYTDLRKTNPGEARAASLLIRAALAAGYGLSISAGDGGPARLSPQSRNAALTAFRDCLGACEDQRVQVWRAEGERLGTFLLIWGNDPDGSELLADYSDNPICSALYDEVADRLGA